VLFSVLILLTACSRRGRRALGVAAEVDAFSRSREDHEHEAGHDRHARRQVPEQLLGIIVGFREEAVLEPHVAAGDGEEHNGPEDGVEAVNALEAAFPELLRYDLLLLPRQVEVEASRKRHALVYLAVVDDAVREGGEDAGGAEDGDETHGEPPVGGVPVALIGEGRGQRLERQHQARRELLEHAILQGRYAGCRRRRWPGSLGAGSICWCSVRHFLMPIE
jgi:hypothetical protein